MNLTWSTHPDGSETVQVLGFEYKLFPFRTEPDRVYKTQITSETCQIIDDRNHPTIIAKTRCEGMHASILKAIVNDPVRIAALEALETIEWNAVRRVGSLTYRICPCCYNGDPASKGMALKGMVFRSTFGVEGAVTEEYSAEKFGHRLNCKLAAALTAAKE